MISNKERRSLEFHAEQAYETFRFALENKQYLDAVAARRANEMLRYVLDRVSCVLQATHVGREEGAVDKAMLQYVLGDDTTKILADFCQAQEQDKDFWPDPTTVTKTNMIKSIDDKMVPYNHLYVRVAALARAHRFNVIKEAMQHVRENYR